VSSQGFEYDFYGETIFGLFLRTDFSEWSSVMDGVLKGGYPKTTGQSLQEPLVVVYNRPAFF